MKANLNVTFYKEEKFKETPIGKIPEDWEIVRHGDVITYIKGKKPKIMTEEDRNGYLPYLSTDYLRSGKPTQFVKITENEIIVRDGDIILLWDGSNAGEFFLGRKGILSSTMVQLNLREGYYNNLFLFYLLKKKEAILKDQTRGTGIPHVDKNVFDDLIIPLPSSKEQEAIAHILSTVDKAIQKTDEIIEKTERLKKGLMQELLTKGIGHKEFKDTEIGRIPKEWEVVKVGGVLTLEYGEGLPERKRVPGEYPVVGSNGIVGYHNQASVKGPGIVVGRKGTIGAVTWIDNDFWPIDTTYYVKTRTTSIHLKWLFYELTYLNPARFHLADVVPGLKRELVHALKMPLPPFNEQKKIVEVLSTVYKKLEIEREEKERLVKIKQGLMDLLLTGKIRVKVN